MKVCGLCTSPRPEAGLAPKWKLLSRPQAALRGEPQLILWTSKWPMAEAWVTCVGTRHSGNVRRQRRETKLPKMCRLLMPFESF